MPSLSSPQPSTVSAKQLAEKYEAQFKAAMKHVADTESKSRKKKAAAAITTSAPIDDFILFEEAAVIERQRSNRSKASSQSNADSQNREERQQKLADASLPRDSPRRKPRKERHGGFSIDPVTDDGTDKEDATKRRWREKPPPAPSPPRLDSPELSDADEDALWGDCRARGCARERKNAA